MKNKGFALVPVLIIVLIVVGLVGVYYFGTKNKNKNPQIGENTPTPLATQTPSNSQSTATPNSTSKTRTGVVIPSDWKKFTAVDPDFGIKTTLSLPSGFSFKFTGSEFLIQKGSDASELWTYLTSITRLEGQENATNTYAGGSRREWYQKYFTDINGVGTGKILNFEDKNENGISYLVANVQQGNITQKHYLYLKNNIVNIFKPSSEVAYSSKAIIPQNVATVFYSLSVEKTK